MARTKRKIETASAPVLEPKANGLWFVQASQVQEKEQEYLLPGRIIKNAYSIIQGPKCCGKSTWIRAIASYVSGGKPIPKFPGKQRKPGKVLYYVGEESLEETVRPGLRRMGANMDNILLADKHGGDKSNALRLPSEANRLIDLVFEHEIELVIIDPIFCFLSEGAEIEGGSTGARAFTDTIYRICKQGGTTVLLSRNVTKVTNRGALNAGRGSGELGNAARSVLHVQEIPGGEEFAFAVAAINGGEIPPTIRYRFEKFDGGVKLDILGDSDITADEVASGEDGGLERTMIQRAKVLIETLIGDGRLDSVVVKEKAGQAMIGERTLLLAAQQLKVIREHEGNRENTRTFWMPPKDGWPKKDQK